MNAYELADKAEQLKTGEYGYVDGWMDEAAYMLRQQADRIAELEKCLFQMQNACIDLTEQSAEPVAWIDPKELDMDVSTTVTKNKQFDTDIPLYTTPQIKELSDDEIWEVIDNCFGVHAFNLDAQIELDEAREDAFDLVKTVLTKASEK